jgi:hypothetical protein
MISYKTTLIIIVDEVILLIVFDSIFSIAIEKKVGNREWIYVCTKIAYIMELP